MSQEEHNELANDTDRPRPDTDAADQGKDVPGADMPSFELLTRGLMKQILPRIEGVQDKVSDITKNQTVLVESLQKENEKLEESNVNKEIESSMAELKHYHAKLLRLRNEMAKLRERTAKMKQRSQKLKHLKEKEDLKKQEMQHKLLEQEQSLVAKPASKPS